MTPTTHNSSWTTAQRKALWRYYADPAWTLAYHCTDAHGFSANGGDRRVRNVDGATHEGVPGIGYCAPGALHATTDPHKWKGRRVWVVALWNAVEVESGKFATRALRVIVGEILHDDVMDQRIAARFEMGANLYGANLDGANLRGANLYGANLYGANLDGHDIENFKRRGAVLGDA